jgi:ParB family chromosome partitioning protein
MIQKKTGLGRGLDALISMDDTPTSVGSGASISDVDIDLIHPNPNQPRREFDEEALNELAESIAHIGIIQPITLRSCDDGTYLIIAGERRWRAAQKAGLLHIPAYIRTAADSDVMEMALIENIQREDLNAIEVSLAYQQLIDQYGLTQEELAARVGKKRTTVTNSLRLLKLPAQLQLAIKNKSLSMGHARALLPLEDAELQIQLYQLIVANDLPVRRVESLVRDYLEGKITGFGAPAPAPQPKVDANQAELFALLTEHLSQMFSAKVKMTCNDKGQGRITIPFKSDKELEHIIALLDEVNAK